MPVLAAIVANGECRLIGNSDTDLTDRQGFPKRVDAARTEGFIPCSWSIKTGNRSETDEAVFGGQPRGFVEYEVMIERTIGDTAIEVQTDDVMELREEPGGASVMLNVLSAINQTGSAWFVRAVNTNA